MSSAHFNQSNGRAEVTVKSAKPLMSNTGPTGSLDHDRFLGAMLQLHNTSEPECNILPAQIIFGRPQKRNTLLHEPPGEILKSKCMPTLVPRMAAKEQALCSQISLTPVSL